MGAGDIKDKRPDEIKYKSPVKSNQELTDSRILEWLSKVAFTWEDKPQNMKDTAVMQKYILPVFKKLAKTYPYIIKTLMNLSDFKIIFLFRGVHNINLDNSVSMGFNVEFFDIFEKDSKPHLCVQFDPADVSVDELQESIYREVIEYSDKIFKTSKYQTKEQKERARQLSQALDELYGFLRMRIMNMDYSPKEVQKNIEENIKKLKKKIRDLKASK